jgi:hypothetical protein
MKNTGWADKMLNHLRDIDIKRARGQAQRFASRNFPRQIPGYTQAIVNRVEQQSEEIIDRLLMHGYDDAIVISGLRISDFIRSMLDPDICPIVSILRDKYRDNAIVPDEVTIYFHYHDETDHATVGLVEVTNCGVSFLNVVSINNADVVYNYLVSIKQYASHVHTVELR